MWFTNNCTRQNAIPLQRPPQRPPPTFRERMGNLFSSIASSFKSSNESDFREDEREPSTSKKSKKPTELIEEINIDYTTCKIDFTGKPLHDETFKEALSRHRTPKEVKCIVLTKNEHITTVPIIIGAFDGITELKLRDNYIRELPWSIVYLKQLQKLDLSYNMLTSLSRLIGHLPSLLTLDLTGNHLTHLPTDLLNLTKLKQLNVDKNKLISPPLSICMKGKDAIFSQLEKRSHRADLWAHVKPWINSSENGEYVANGVRSLLATCVDTIIECRVDFLHPDSVPPVIKNHLSQKTIEYESRIQVAKCSQCKKYYSSKAKFDSHFCK